MVIINVPVSLFWCFIAAAFGCFFFLFFHFVFLSFTTFGRYFNIPLINEFRRHFEKTVNEGNRVYIATKSRSRKGNHEINDHTKIFEQKRRRRMRRNKVTETAKQKGRGKHQEAADRRCDYKQRNN